MTLFDIHQNALKCHLIIRKYEFSNVFLFLIFLPSFFLSFFPSLFFPFFFFFLFSFSFQFWITSRAGMAGWGGMMGGDVFRSGWRSNWKRSANAPSQKTRTKQQQPTAISPSQSEPIFPFPNSPPPPSSPPTLRVTAFHTGCLIRSD